MARHFGNRESDAPVRASGDGPDGRGTVVDETITHRLDIKGVIFVDGNFRFDEDGEIIHYYGRANIMSSRDDEIDALEVMGIDSITFLCATRLLAAWIVTGVVGALGSNAQPPTLTCPGGGEGGDRRDEPGARLRVPLERLARRLTRLLLRGRPGQVDLQHQGAVHAAAVASGLPQ